MQPLAREPAQLEQQEGIAVQSARQAVVGAGDVLAGIGWAFVSLPAAVWVSNKIISRMTQAKLETAAKIWLIIYVALVILLCNI